VKQKLRLRLKVYRLCRNRKIKVKPDKEQLIIGYASKIFLQQI
jgi:hypothetical protein